MSNRIFRATWHPAFALLGLLLAPLILRILLGFEQVGGLDPHDLRGVVADIFASAIVFTLLVLLSRLSRALATLLALPWVLLHYGNYEVVRTLGATLALADFHFLGDATFVRGSVTALSHPVLLAGLILGSLTLCWLGLGRFRLRVALGGSTLALVLLAVLGVWPWNADLALWRQTDLLPQELGRLASSTSTPTATTTNDPATAMVELLPDLAANLDGEPRFPLPGKKQNVLLVVLESVSGAYVERFLLEHWDRGEGSMPVLDSVARDNLGYATFINHQRRTNRGLYALLCGEIPNLLTGVPKMSSYSIDGTRRCLPEILGAVGYATTYLQAAPLVFMLKDQFMPRIGFQEVHGDDWFSHGYARTSWGVDDRAFLEQSTRMIADLQARNQPWFLTLLTVGTHHPFLVPESFQPQTSSDFQRTIAYLDLALEGFMEDLENLGILENTLVLLTSDESLGRRGGPSPIARRLSQNWGFLVAITPEQVQDIVSEPFAQMDLPLSVLDYVGLAEEGRHLFGRSFFRSYRQPRSLFFANANTRMAGTIDAESRLIMCLNDFEACHAHRPIGGRLFGPEHEELTLEGPEARHLQEMSWRSVRQRPEDEERLQVDLQARQLERVDSPKPRLLHGGQGIDLDTGEWVEVELDVEVRSGGDDPVLNGDGVALVATLRAARRPEIHREQIDLRPGQRLHLVYTYAPGHPIREVQSQLFARSPEGDAYELVFRRARISLIRQGVPPGSGVEVHQKQIDHR